MRKLRATSLMVLGLLTLFTLSHAIAQAEGGSTVWLPLVLRAWPTPTPTPTPTLTPTPIPNPVYTGQATYYDATGGGACSFPPSPDDLMVAAMNGAQYNNAAWCGAYVRVNGWKGSVIVRIVDLCPGCAYGDLDLSREAFGQIANLSQGRVSITWQLVSPNLDGPIRYHFKDGSSRWWAAVQVRNHRNPIARFEVYLNNAWVEIPRQSYNYFVKSGMGAGPFTFRVTDIYGNMLVDEGIPLLVGQEVSGAAQFPPGP